MLRQKSCELVSCRDGEEENVCISAERCWSPCRVRGRQRETGREKAKWWELEQQQLLLPRSQLMPGNPLGCQPASPKVQVPQVQTSYKVGGTSRSQVELFYFFLSLQRTSVWGLRSFSGLKEVFCVLSVFLFWKQVRDQGKNNSGQDVKADVQRGGGLLSLSCLIVELRQWGAPVIRRLFNLKHGGWERQG